MEVVQNPTNTNQMSFSEREDELKKQQEKEEEQRKRERHSPFTSFYQVNKENSQYLRNCLDENPQALKLLFFLFDHMDKYNAVMCSYAVFREVLGVSTPTITRSIRYLKERGFIYVYKSGSSNVYVANSNLVWNSWGNNIKYCQFPANIVLSASEQEKTVKNIRLQSVQLKEGSADEQG